MNEKEKENTNIQLSIIVPVYNVEMYIRPCIESIYKQNLDEKNFEVIIVNDGTEDRSMEAIQDIVTYHKNINVINQKNQGLSIARNNGIAVATGKYILLLDSDDLLIENSLKPLLDIAMETNADLIVADYLKMTNIEISNCDNISQKGFSVKEKNGEQLLEDLSPYECYIWHILFRRKYLLDEGIKFYPGIAYEDVPFIHECYIKAGKCIRASWLLNIYRRRPGSTTYLFSQKKAFDFCTAIAKTWELTRMEHLSTKARAKLQNDIFASFSLLVCRTGHDIKKVSEKKAILDYMKQQAPDMVFKNGIKQRTVSYMYKHIPYIYLYLRYIYGKMIEDNIYPVIRKRY